MLILKDTHLNDPYDNKPYIFMNIISKKIHLFCMDKMMLHVPQMSLVSLGYIREILSHVPGTSFEIFNEKDRLIFKISSPFKISDADILSLKNMRYITNDPAVLLNKDYKIKEFYKTFITDVDVFPEQVDIPNWHAIEMSGMFPNEIQSFKNLLAKSNCKHKWYNEKYLFVDSYDEYVRLNGMMF